MNRRDILTLAATGVSSTLLPSMAPAAGVDAESITVIDTNVSLFRWPFRRLPLDETAALVAKLRSLGVSRAWAGSFEAIWHRDIASANERLADDCAKHTLLEPIGSINPTLPGWVTDLDRCAEAHNMRAVRIHPNYHGYKLDDDLFAELLMRATDRGMFVQIAAAIEDTRTQPTIMQVPDVDLAPLARVMGKVSGARVQVLNYRPNPKVVRLLRETAGVCFDTARVDGTDGVPKLVNSLPPGRVLFGSHAPFLIPEAALIRTHESGQLEQPALRRLLAEDARTFSSRAAR